MSTFNDTDWTNKENSEMCVSHIRTSQELHKKIPSWTLVIPGPRRRRKKWYGTHTYKLDGKWNSIAEEMVEHFKEKLDTQYSEVAMRFIRGILKRKGGRCTIHFNADSSNTELLVSHSKSTQYLRSSGELVRRSGSVYSWSKRVDHGEVRSKGERTVTQKAGAARSEFFSANSMEE